MANMTLSLTDVGLRQPPIYDAVAT